MPGGGNTGDGLRKGGGDCVRSGEGGQYCCTGGGGGDRGGDGDGDGGGDCGGELKFMPWS